MKSLRRAADSSNLYKRPRADLPEIDLHDVRHKHSNVNVDAGVAFTLNQYVQTDLQAGRKAANTLTALIIGGSIASTQITDEPRADQGATVGDSGEAARRQPRFNRVSKPVSEVFTFQLALSSRLGLTVCGLWRLGLFPVRRGSFGTGVSWLRG